MSFLFRGLAFGFESSDGSFSVNDVVSTAAVNLGLTEGGITGTGRCGGGGAALLRITFISLHLDELDTKLTLG